MATLVGTQNSIVDAIQNLIKLDYDAVEAYDAAINRLDNEMHKIQLRAFKEDHERHIREFSQILRAQGEDAPSGPGGKQWLTKGKVLMGNLVGDKAILMAMRSNEVDTNTAYERMSKHDERTPEVNALIQRGLEDERRHKAWFDTILRT